MNLKKMVGDKAGEFVEDGMIVGLGTGSTARYMVEAVAKRMKEEGLQITGVTTSVQTAEQAKELSIPLKSIDEVEAVDVTIDGADEISRTYQGIKGGGAAHLFEKIVASYSKKNIWIVDESKIVEELGAFPLPIEVIPFGSEQLYRLFEKEGLQPEWREDDNGGKLKTDSDNFVIDLHIGEIKEPHQLASWLQSLTGVVEHGLFLDTVHTIIIGKENGPEVKEVR